jgi:iron complex transport system permease protein
MALSARYGAVSININEIWSSLSKLFNSQEPTLNERIFMNIRLPRAILCILVGASLSTGGVLLQALFRNPIVEPGLIGTSSGAALGASLYFVLGSLFHWHAGEWTLPLIACAGAIFSTYIVFILSETKEVSRSSVILLLLTGIAVNAICMSGVGFLSYIARDPQARSITFWGMGTLSGANWHTVVAVGLSTLLCLALSRRYARQLNALMLGESEAMLLGVNVRRLKLIVLSINVIMVAVATAFVGVISFVGLIVPHLMRMIEGSDNRQLLLSSALMGGIILSLADLAARLLVSPAELPIGIVTSIVGAPFFIALLRRNKYFF